MRQHDEPSIPATNDGTKHPAARAHALPPESSSWPVSHLPSAQPLLLLGGGGCSGASAAAEQDEVRELPVPPLPLLMAPRAAASKARSDESSVDARWRTRSTHEARWVSKAFRASAYGPEGASERRRTNTCRAASRGSQPGMLRAVSEHSDASASCRQAGSTRKASENLSKVGHRSIWFGTILSHLAGHSKGCARLS